MTEQPSVKSYFESLLSNEELSKLRDLVERIPIIQWGEPKKSPADLIREVLAAPARLSLDVLGAVVSEYELPWVKNPKSRELRELRAHPFYDSFKTCRTGDAWVLEQCLELHATGYGWRDPDAITRPFWNFVNQIDS